MFPFAVQYYHIGNVRVTNDEEGSKKKKEKEKYYISRLDTEKERLLLYSLYKV